MNRGEAAQVVELIMRGWSQATNWDDAQIELWIDDLVALELDRAKGAFRLCRDEHDFPPSWAQFKDAYRRHTFAKMDPSRNPPSVRALPSNVLPKAENMRRVSEVRAMLRQVTSPAPHNHHPKKVRQYDNHGDPLLDEHGEEAFTLITGALACPVCSLHDRNAEGLHKPEHCTRCKQIGHDIYDQIRGDRG